MRSGSYKKKISRVRWIISTIILVPMLTVWSFFLSGHWKTFKVISRSMEPTLLVNDCVVMREQHNYPNLDNEIVVIQDPQGGTFPLVKRVIAGPNSTVRVSRGKVYLDGSDSPLPGDSVGRESPNKTWRVDAEEIFVLGDNRSNSQDSSEFGPISRSQVLGVVAFRYWPLGRAGAVK